MGNRCYSPQRSQSGKSIFSAKVFVDSAVEEKSKIQQKQNLNSQEEDTQAFIKLQKQDEEESLAKSQQLQNNQADIITQQINIQSNLQLDLHQILQEEEEEKLNENQQETIQVKGEQTNIQEEGQNGDATGIHTVKQSRKLYHQLESTDEVQDDDQVTKTIGFRTKLLSSIQQHVDIDKVTLELRYIINLQNNRDVNNNQKINELFPDLQILRLLGRGTFGQVHECYEPRLKVSKALKIMQHERSQLLQNLKEIAMISKINKECKDIMPKINAFEAGLDKGNGFYNTKILMEIGYCTLYTYAKAVQKSKCRFTEQQLILILKKMSYAFYELQKIGIAHRDIKPDNIMIDYELERILLIDIGLGEYSSLNDNMIFQDLVCNGSPLYMSPEIFQSYLEEDLTVKKQENIVNNIQDNQNYNYIKSDVYSAAISLIQIYDPQLSQKNDKKLSAKRKQYIDLLERDFQQIFPNLYQILKQMLSQKQEDRPDFGQIYNLCDKLINKEETKRLLINERVKRWIEYLNMTGLSQNPFEDSLRIIESYIELTKYQEALTMINKLNNIVNQSNFNIVSLKCLEVLIQIKIDEEEIEDIIEELMELNQQINKINLTEFEDTQKIITYINQISSQIYDQSNAKRQKTSVLLHVLTFKIKGKFIPVKVNQIMEYLMTLNNKSELIKVAQQIQIKRGNKLLENAFDYLIKTTQKQNLEGNTQAFRQYLIKGVQKEKVITEFHQSSILSVEHIPNTKLIVTGSADKTVRLWNYETQELIRTFEVGTKEINQVKYIQGTKLIMSCSDDKSIKIWNYETYQLVTTLIGHVNLVLSLEYITGTKLIVSGGWDNIINIWNYETSQLIYTLKGHDNTVTSLIHIPKTKFIVSGSSDNTIKIWNYQKYQLIHTFQGHNDHVTCLGYIPDTNQLISCSKDKTIKMWGLDVQNKLIHVFEGHTSGVTSVIHIPGTKYIVSGSKDFTVKIWNYDKKYFIKTLFGHENGVNSIALIKNTKFIISGSADKTMKIWDYEKQIEHNNLSITFENKIQELAINSNKHNNYTNQFDTIVDGHTNSIKCIVCIPQTKYIVSASLDKSIKIWNYQTKELIQSLEGHTLQISTVTVIPDSKYIVSAGYDLTIKIWSYETYKLISTLKGHMNSVLTVECIPNTKYIVTGSADKTIKIWNYETEEFVHSIQAHNKDINQVKHVHNSKYIISCSEDKTIKIWNYETYSLINTLSNHTESATSLEHIANTKFILSGSIDKSIKIWNYETCELIQTLLGHKWTINSLVHIPNTNYIASGSVDNTIRIWNYQTYELLHTLQGHTDSVNSVQYISKTNQIISCSNDKTIKLWNWQLPENELSTKYQFKPIQLLNENNKEYILFPQMLLCYDNTTEYFTNPFLNAIQLKSKKIVCAKIYDTSIKIYDNIQELKNHKFKELIGHSSLVVSLYECPHTNQLYSGSIDNTIKQWNILQQQCIKTINVHSVPLSICTVLNGQKLVYSVQNSFDIQIYNENQISTITLKKHKNTITHLLSIQKGHQNLLVSGGYDCFAVLWDVTNQQILAIFDYVQSQITHLSLFPDEQEELIAIGYETGNVAAWNINNPLHYQMSRRLPLHQARLSKVGLVYYPQNKSEIRIISFNDNHCQRYSAKIIKRQYR